MEHCGEVLSLETLEALCSSRVQMSFTALSWLQCVDLGDLDLPRGCTFLQRARFL